MNCALSWLLQTSLKKTLRQFPSLHASHVSATTGSITFHNKALFIPCSQNSALIHTNPLHAHPILYLRSMLILSSHLCLRQPSGLFPSRFPTKTHHVPPHCPMHATWPTRLKLLYLKTLMVLGQDYKSRCSLLCIILQYPVTSSV